MIAEIFANGLWQGAIIVAIAYIAARISARESASTRYAIWFVALLAMAFVPAISTIWPLHLPSFENALGSGRQGTIRFTLIAATTFVDRAAPFMTAASIAWLAGAALAFARLAASALRIARIRRNAVPLAGYDDVVVSDMVDAPIAAGMHSPVVIVPAVIFQRLSPDEVALIVAHERAHIVRRDIAMNLVQRAIEAALFFNPWVHMIGHHLVKEREAACDDAAVAKTGEIDEYAACLAAVARAISDPRAPLVSPSVLGSRHALVQRIERLVNERTVRERDLNWYAIGSAVIVFTIAAVVLGSCAPSYVASNRTPHVSMAAVAAKSCANPNTDAQVTNPAPPDYPDGAHPKRPVLLRVTVAADGTVPRVNIMQSSGDWRADTAAVDASTNSRYVPAVRNCHPVQGTYVFRAEFAPNP